MMEKYRHILKFTFINSCIVSISKVYTHLDNAHRFRWLCTCFLGLLLLVSSSLYGQRQAYLDSLLMTLAESERDTLRVQLLATISEEYLHFDPDEAATYLEEALALSKELQYPEGEAQAYDGLGAVHYEKFDMKNAISFYMRALERYKGMGDRVQIEISTLYNKIGQVHLTQRNFELAKESYEHSLELAAHIGEPKLLGNAHNGLAAYYIYLGNYLESNDSLKYRSYFEKAIPFLERAVLNFREAGYEKGEALVYGNSAYANERLGHYDEALAYALEAMKYFEGNGLENYLAISYNQISELYLELEKYDQAEEYALKGLRKGTKMGNLNDQFKSYDVLYSIYVNSGDLEKAILYGEKKYELSKMLYDKEKEREIATIQKEYDTEILENENLLLRKETALKEANLSRQRILIWIVLGTLLVITVIALLNYRNFRTKKRFARKVEALQAAQSHWFTNISHELRTPLTLLLGPLKNILDRGTTIGETRGDAQLAYKSGKRLLQLVNEILDISRMDADKLGLARAPTDMTRLLTEIEGHFKPFAKQKGVRLTTSFESEVFLDVDSGKIRNVLTNLVANALKFTDTGGEVHMALRIGEEVKISVMDTGIGIPQQDLGHIFDRFYQVSRPDSINHGGSGVGLAFSRELAKMHGGSLTATSAEGEGSTFVLSLPKALICEPHERPQRIEEAMPEAPTERPFVYKKVSGSTILVVEDHPEMRDYIAKLLEDVYVVETAIDGKDALGKLKAAPPDLVISDIMMPRMDGLALARSVREDPRHRQIPFITLTAHANERDKLTALRIGVDDYLPKPFDPGELLIRVGNLLENASIRKKAQEGEEATGVKEDVITDEEKWVEELRKYVLETMEDIHFSVRDLAAHVAMSGSSLQRRLKKATGLSPGQFVREIRLQKAAFLLETHQHGTILEVVQAVGFEDSSSFSRLFKRRFGKSPTTFFKETV